MKINRYVIAISIIVLVVFIAINCSSKGHKKEMKTTHVDCDAGQSLIAIVANIKKYTRIVIKGNTCQVDGSIIVTQDNIVIDGNGAVLDGQDTTNPVIIVKSNNVVIKDLTVTRGMHGVVIKKGATAVLKDVNANGNKGSGIVLGKPMRLPNPGENPNQIPGTKPNTLNQPTDNSLSGLFNDMLEKSSFDMSIVKEARASSDNCQKTCRKGAPDLIMAGLLSIVCGVVNANDNVDSGVYVNSASNLQVCGTLHAKNTLVGTSAGQYGIIVKNQSVINIYGFATTQNNGLDGVYILNGSKINLFNKGVRLTSTYNNGVGLRIGDAESAVPTVPTVPAVICNSGSKLNLSGNMGGNIGGNIEGSVSSDCL